MSLSSTLFVAILLGVWASALAVLSRHRGRSVALGSDAHRAARRQRRDDRGASALEWAVISAILVTAAVIIGGVIYNVVSNKSDDIQACGSLGASAESCEQ
jgi:Flp pilus assembly pilin Flp